MAGPEPPPDVASASSAALFRLRHLRLGLELRPDARVLAGCLVLELCARRAAEGAAGAAAAEGGGRPRALVLDAHPALRVASVDLRAARAGEERCGFAFPAWPAGGGAPGRAAARWEAEAAPSPDPAPPPVPTFAAPAAPPCPLPFRLEPFADYGASLSIALPPALDPRQPFQVVVRYTAVEAPAVSIPPPGLGRGGGWGPGPAGLSVSVASCLPGRSRAPGRRCAGGFPPPPGMARAAAAAAAPLP